MKKFLMPDNRVPGSRFIGRRRRRKKHQEPAEKDAIVKEAAIPTYKMAFSIYASCKTERRLISAIIACW